MFFDVVHTVKKNETLSGIIYQELKKRVFLYGHEGMIKRVEKLNPGVKFNGRLKTGTILRLPVMPLKDLQELMVIISPPSDKEEKVLRDGDRSDFKNVPVQTYRVKRGENLSKIVNKRIRAVFRLYGENGIIERARKINIQVGDLNDLEVGTRIRMFITLKDAVVAGPPNPATDLKFQEGEKHKEMTVTACWKKSDSLNIASSKIKFFSDEKCEASLGPQINLELNQASEYSFTAAKVGSYSFNITTVDKMGKQSVSTCSSPIKITHGYAPFSLIAKAEPKRPEEEELPKQQESVPEDVYIGDRFFIELEGGAVDDSGRTQNAEYGTSYVSSRLTVHGKPFAFKKSTRRHKLLGNLLASIWYQMGGASNATADVGIKGYGFSLYEYIFKNVVFSNLKIGPQLIFEKYELDSSNKSALSNVAYTAGKIGVVFNYKIPRIWSDLTVDFNYAPILSYSETPAIVEGVGSKSMIDFSFRFLRRFSRRIDLGFGYDYRKISVTTSQNRKMTGSTNKLALFGMWHYE